MCKKNVYIIVQLISSTNMSDVWAVSHGLLNRNLILAHRLASMKMTSTMGPGVLGEMTHCSGWRWMLGG